MLFRKAILMIHGFAGGVYDYEVLDHYLELNPLFDVYSFTLPGHGVSTKIKSKYTEWILKSEEEIDYLINNGYRTIYVIGHSMGGVIATYLATKYKEIKKLVLVAPAFKYFYQKDDSLLDILKKGNVLLKDYGYETVVSRFTKTSINSVKEFMSLVKNYYDTPKYIHIPTLIIQGLDDKIVPIESSKYVYNNLKGKKWLVYVKDTNHDVFKSRCVDEINRLIEEFLKRNIIKDRVFTIGNLDNDV